MSEHYYHSSPWPPYQQYPHPQPPPPQVFYTPLPPGYFPPGGGMPQQPPQPFDITSELERAQKAIRGWKEFESFVKGGEKKDTDKKKIKYPWDAMSSGQVMFWSVVAMPFVGPPMWEMIKKLLHIG